MVGHCQRTWNPPRDFRDANEQLLDIFWRSTPDWPLGHVDIDVDLALPLHIFPVTACHYGNKICRCVVPLSPGEVMVPRSQENLTAGLDAKARLADIDAGE